MREFTSSSFWAASAGAGLPMVAPHARKAIAKLHLTLPPTIACFLCHNPIVHPSTHAGAFSA